MERDIKRRTSERIALAHNQKPRRTIDDFKNPFGEEVYPYAWPVTYAFLKAAIDEGAHLIVPKALRSGGDAQERWVRKINIAAVYFGSKATEEDIGRMYGYSQNSLSESPNVRSAPQKHIRTFIKLLWGNCSEGLRERFPLDQIPLDKPLSEESRQKIGIGISSAVNGVFQRALPLILEGRLTRSQIVQEVNGEEDSIESIVRRRRARGILPPTKRMQDARLRESHSNKTRHGKENVTSLVLRIPQFPDAISTRELSDLFNLSPQTIRRKLTPFLGETWLGTKQVEGIKYYSRFVYDRSSCLVLKRVNGYK